MTSHLTCSHRVLLALLAVCFTFSCDRERHGVVPAAAIAPIQEARGPSPLMSASASTSLAAVEVNQTLYCRILARVADKLEAEVNAARQQPSLTEEDAHALLDKLNPTGGGRALFADVFREQGISGDAVAAFVRRDPSAADHCVKQFQDRLGRAGSVITSITQSASPSGSSGPSFRTDLGKALQDARVQGRGVLLVFSAAWDPVSTQMGKETFRNTDVQSQIDARFIAVRVDITDDNAPGVQKALLSYAVVGLPTLILLDASGKEVKRLTELTDAAGLLESLAAVPTNVVSTRAAGR